MSASTLDADYPWLQEHLRDLAHDKAQMAKHQEMLNAGIVFPHDLENPAGCWVELVMACRLQDPNARKQHVLKWNALARCSRWNREMLNALGDDSDDEPEVTFANSEEEMDHHQAVKDLLDAADAEAFKGEALGRPVDLDEDEEPMTEPYMED